MSELHSCLNCGPSVTISLDLFFLASPNILSRRFLYYYFSFPIAPMALITGSLNVPLCLPEVRLANWFMIPPKQISLNIWWLFGIGLDMRCQFWKLDSENSFRFDWIFGIFAESNFWRESTCDEWFNDGESKAFIHICR